MVTERKTRLSWIEDKCMRLLYGMGGKIQDWPALRVKLAARQAEYIQTGEGKSPSPNEMEEAWLELGRKGYVALEYDRLSLKSISKQEILPQYEPQVSADAVPGQNRINLVCDILSYLFILPAILFNNICGLFPLAFALALTGSKRKWTILRIGVVVFGTILAFAFFYNLIQ
jgi:hypothetical protein